MPTKRWRRLLLTDDELLSLVRWPATRHLSAGDVRRTLRTTRRFVDFDGTIAGHDQRPLPTICNVPLKEFLDLGPYVVQTWNPFGAVKFFNSYPEFPRPELIVVVPIFLDDDAHEDVNGFGKDFTGLGIQNALIYDDFPTSAIRAPGCTHLLP